MDIRSAFESKSFLANRPRFARRNVSSPEINGTLGIHDRLINILNHRPCAR
jgi:hypothetical protein